jgi:hypothetical protein
MSQVGNEWSLPDGRILQYRDRVLDQKVDTTRLPFSAQVGNYVYHSNIPRIRLSGVMIDLRNPLTPEQEAILLQTLPPSIQQQTDKIQTEFQQKKAREAEEAKTRYFRETSAGQQEVFTRRYQQYLAEHPEMVAFQKIVDGLIKVGDAIIPVAGAVGMPSFLIDIYKKFAPPGSKFYTKGALEDKLMQFAKEKGEAYIKSVVQQEGTKIGKQLIEEAKRIN